LQDGDDRFGRVCGVEVAIDLALGSPSARIS